MSVPIFDGVSHRRTARLLLRPIAFSDADFAVALFARPELVAHRPDRTPVPPDSTRKSLTADMAHWDAHSFGRWTIELDGLVIGFGGLTRRNGFGGLNLSYHLEPTAWRRGFATEIVAEALAVAFGPLKQTRVFGLVRPANLASRRVMQKAGFHFERQIEITGAPMDLLALERAIPS